MEAPYLPNSIFGPDFEHVYEPAEDTYLLLDALEKDLPALKRDAFVCLECGSGSGTVITALSKSLNGESHQSRLMLATDINPRACETTIKCARYHNQNHLQVVRTNLAEALVDRMRNSIDLLVFNPPYVPTSQSEIETGTTEKPIYLSWAGGQDGRTATNRFLEYIPKLLSKPSGVAYLVALEQNNINQLKSALSDEGLTGTVAIQRRAGSENLFVIKYCWS